MTWYQLLLLKRGIEDAFIFLFIVVGRMIARFRPLENEFRIYFFFPFYHTGGAEKVHAQVATATGGRDCVIFFTRKSQDNRYLEDFRKTNCIIKDISIYTDNKWLYFFNLIYRGIITGYINKQKLKPVVFNGQCNFGYKICPWIRKNIPQTELIHSLNSFSHIRIPFLPCINRTVMISRKRIDDHRDLYKRYHVPADFLNRIIFIPNAIEIPSSSAEKKEEPFTVLYAGRGTTEKRVHLVAEIAAILHQKEPGINTEIMGDVSNTLNEKDYPFIRFHGNIKEQDRVESIYANAHILLITSYTEGFPMVIMEAMAHACAVISTSVGEIPLHIRNGENGFLFSDTIDEKKIINEAVEKIILLKNDPVLFKKISEENIRYASLNFGIERFNNAYSALLGSYNK